MSKKNNKVTAIGIAVIIVGVAILLLLRAYGLH